MIRVNSAGLMCGAVLAIGNGEFELGLAVRLADSAWLVPSSCPCGRFRAVGLRSTCMVRGVLACRRPRETSRYGSVGICDAGDVELEPK